MFSIFIALHKKLRSNRWMLLILAPYEMNPRQPYPPPYVIPPYPLSTPQKGPPRQMYYDTQQGTPYYQAQALSVYPPPQGAPPSYGPPQIYSQPPGYYPYQAKQIIYTEQQQHPMFVSQAQPPPPSEPAYLAPYQEIAQPIYQRPQPPQPSVMHVPPIQQAALAKPPPPAQAPPPPPPPPKREKTVASPAQVAKPAADDLKLQVANKQTFLESETPPGEFDMVTRGGLPSIVFRSEVTVSHKM